MNEIVNKFLLARYKFMPEMHLDLCIVLVDHLPKKKKEKKRKEKECKNSKNKEIYNIFIKTD